MGRVDGQPVCHPRRTRRITRIFAPNFFLFHPLSREARRLSSFSVARRRRPIELKQIASISGKLLPRRVSSYISVQSSINSGPFVSGNYSSVPRWHSYGANTFGFYRFTLINDHLDQLIPYIIHGREGRFEDRGDAQCRVANNGSAIQRGRK